MKKDELLWVDEHDRKEFPSPMDGTIVRMVTNDSIQNGVYISDGNFEVPKTSKKKLDSLSKSLKRASQEGSKLLIPTGVPLNSLVTHKDAAKIYHQVFKMVDAYFDCHAAYVQDLSLPTLR